MKNSDSIPELVSPKWQPKSKVIGYGIDALVFHPPFFVPNERQFPEAAQIMQHPYGFVGSIVAQEHYQNVIQNSTKLLNSLRSRNPLFCNYTVLPISVSAETDFVFLQEEHVSQLVNQHHAVRKKVEYLESWKGKRLVQLIYPYAGMPLSKCCDNPQNAPDWSTFFRSMSGVARFVQALHNDGYVHGDLSPNNLLFNEILPDRFTVVDWNMLCPAQEFLNHRKGMTRVGSWSPEHFSLTSERLKESVSDLHWVIYAEEMHSYLKRLLEFNLSCATEQVRTKVREYFDRFLEGSRHPVLLDMYKELGQTDASSISKYHDIRYLMDTIAKCVHFIFPTRSKGQEEHYNSFVALSLVQNLPDRSGYLQSPDSLIQKLIMILKACRSAESDDVQLPVETDAERDLMQLLQHGLNH